MSTSERPAPGYPAPEGFEHVAVADTKWRLVSGKKCRRQLGGRVYCRRPSVAEFDRGSSVSRNNWWAYCARHMYGRWIENGQVMVWILREREES